MFGGNGSMEKDRQKLLSRKMEPITRLWSKTNGQPLKKCQRLLLKVLKSSRFNLGVGINHRSHVGVAQAKHRY